MRVGRDEFKFVSVRITKGEAWSNGMEGKIFACHEKEFAEDIDIDIYMVFQDGNGRFIKAENCKEIGRYNFRDDKNEFNNIKDKPEWFLRRAAFKKVRENVGKKYILLDVSNVAIADYVQFESIAEATESALNQDGQFQIVELINIKDCIQG